MLKTRNFKKRERGTENPTEQGGGGKEVGTHVIFEGDFGLHLQSCVEVLLASFQAAPGLYDK
jgi:hypothetical protein